MSDKKHEEMESPEYEKMEDETESKMSPKKHGPGCKCKKCKGKRLHLMG